MTLEEVKTATTASIARWSDRFKVDTGLAVTIGEETTKAGLPTSVMTTARPALASESDEPGSAREIYKWSDTRATTATMEAIERLALEAVVQFVRAQTRQITLLEMGESLFGPDWSWHAAACVVAMAQNAPDRYDPDTAGADYVLGERTMKLRPSYPPQQGETLFSNGRRRSAGVAHVIGARRVLPNGRRVLHTGSPTGYHMRITGVQIPETVVSDFLGRPLTDLVDDESLTPAAHLCTVLDVENDEHGMSLRLDEPDVLLARPPSDADLGWLDIGRAEMKAAGAFDPLVTMPWKAPSERKRP